MYIRGPMEGKAYPHLANLPFIQGRSLITIAEVRLPVIRQNFVKTHE